MKKRKSISYPNIRRRAESGTIIVLNAIASAALILVAGLCIDISHLYLVSAELQNAADAAALSAASALNSTANGVTTAVDRAIAVTNRYDFGNQTATIGRDDVRFAVNLCEFDSGGTGRSESSAAASPRNIRFVQVTIPQTPVTIFFAIQAFGSQTFNLTRGAVAGQSSGLNIVCNVAPLSVVEDPVTGAPLNVNPECPDQTRFTPGCTYTARLDSGGGNGNGHGNGSCSSSGSISPGNYLILAIGGDRGGSDTRRRLAIGTDSCFDPTQTVYTEPGVEAGPVRQGLNVRFDEYTGNLSPDEFPPDANIKTDITYSQYRSGLSMYTVAPSHTGVSGRRVLIIPIVKSDQFDNGRNAIEIDRFGAFFLQDKVPNGNGGDIRLEYIADPVVIGDGGYLPNSGSSNAKITVAVLYR